MKIQILKPILLSVFTCSLLVACSVDQKPPINSKDVTSDSIKVPNTPDNYPPMISNPEDIVLPPAKYVEPQTDYNPPPQVILPKTKAQLTRKQLFAGTLKAHNGVRAKHGLQPLKWSDKLADYSQQWANHLGKGNSCKMYHRSGSPKHGENLYISSPVIWRVGNKEVSRERNRVTIEDVVKVWTDEERWYNYKNNSCQPGQQCGHYTQIVWRETTEVGCAVKYCGDQSQNWVCSYNPPGNYVGKRPY